MRLENALADARVRLEGAQSELRDLASDRVIEADRPEEEAAPVNPRVILVQPQQPTSPSISTRAPAVRRPTGRPSIRNYYGPFAQVSGDDVLVTGNLRNFGDGQGYATLVVTLYRDGEYVEEQDLALDLGPGDDQSWSMSFSLRGEGTYSARAAIQ